MPCLQPSLAGPQDRRPLAAGASGDTLPVRFVDQVGAVRGLLLIPVLVGMALVWAAMDEGSGIRRSWQLRSDLGAAQERIARLDAEIEQLRREVRDLEQDPFAIERAVREDLDWARPGETIVRLTPAVAPTPRFD
jgi:cell division protein FtsB